MSTKHHHLHRHWVLAPFKALWWFLTLIIEMTGRLVAGILGMVLVLAGVLLSLTIIGAIVGIPLILVGGLLVLRSVF